MKNERGTSAKANNPKLEGHLRDTQNNKGKSGHMTNAARQELGEKPGQPRDYEDWSKGDLYEKAKELGIEQCADMTKEQLLEVLRQHLGDLFIIGHSDSNTAAGKK